MGPWERLLEQAERRRLETLAGLDARRKVELGQYFTHVTAATLIAVLARLPMTGVLRILDPGAGSGSLSAALIARIIRDSPDLDIDLVAVELDQDLLPALERTLADCRAAATSAGIRLRTTTVCDDYVRMAPGLFPSVGPVAEPFDIVIMNPPYRKMSSEERAAVGGAVARCPNLYAAFIARAMDSIGVGGQIVAITPRSFANGPYFSSFRRSFLSQLALDRLHVFESRGTVFADTDVLQENIVFAATKGVRNDSVTLSMSRGHLDEATLRTVPYSQVVSPTDPNCFVRFVAVESDSQAAEIISALPATVGDLGMMVSTGRVVDFRVRPFLRDAPGGETVPLIYPGNLRQGLLDWPARFGSRRRWRSIRIPSRKFSQMAYMFS